MQNQSKREINFDTQLKTALNNNKTTHRINGIYQSDDAVLYEICVIVMFQILKDEANEKTLKQVHW